MTDGRVSFAALIFENPPALFLFVRIAVFVRIGFDGGRFVGRSADVGQYLIDNNLDLQQVNVYRIDGMHNCNIEFSHTVIACS